MLPDFGLLSVPMKNNTIHTMKDIAEALGVSVATVSRALNGSLRISAARREEVRKFAREHDFHPNAIAGRLRNSRLVPTKVIGVIIPQLDHYYFSTILSGIEEQADKYGFRIMVAQSDEHYKREVSICDSFLENRVCGIIVSQAKDTVRYDHFRRLFERRVPLVFYDRICTGMNTSRVVVDDYMGAYNAVSYLVKSGCRRIAFYGTSMNLEISKNRYNGYRDALLKNGLPVDEHLNLFCDNRLDAEEVTPEILRRNDRPDAFFAVNDDTAIGILYTVKRMGLRIPDDVSICGFTNGARAIACDPMLTTVEQRGYKVGEETVEVLLEHVTGKVPVEHAIKRVVRTKLVVRGTTR